jgi:hypothetical protein
VDFVATVSARDHYHTTPTHFLSGVMASSGGGTSDDMELSEVKGSRNLPNRHTFSPAPAQPTVVSRPGLTKQKSDARVPNVYEASYVNPAIDTRWQNRQVGYADQQRADQFSHAEKGYPPGFELAKI